MALAETGIDRDGFRAAAHHWGSTTGATDFVNSGGASIILRMPNNKSIGKICTKDLKKVA